MKDHTTSVDTIGATGEQQNSFEALDAMYPLPDDDLYRQWVLGQDLSGFPAQWETRNLHGWTLAAHADTNVCTLTTEDGAPIGWVIEPMFYLHRNGMEFPSDTLALQVSSSDEITEFEIERALYGRGEFGCTDGTGLGGMWIAILFQPSPRLYLGPIHSVVYDASKKLVATSHNLLAPFSRDIALSEIFDPLATFGYYSFGLTAFQGVDRLLPNHYLDLITFQPVRHWPVAPVPKWSNGSEGAAAIADYGRRLLENLTSLVDEIVVPLSAGKDSRAVLALLRGVARKKKPQINLFTSYGLDFSSRIDLQGGKRLAAIAGLPHEARPRPKHADVPAEVVMRNFARIGEAKVTPLLSNPGTTEPNRVDRPKLVVAGMGGEAGRADYWSRGAPDHMSAEDLLRHVRAPVHPLVLAAAERWLDGLPGFVRAEPADILDLAYIEQRMGCWEANSRYLFPTAIGHRTWVLSPMVSAFSLQTMLGLPKAYRQSGVLQRDMVAHAWPELLTVPFNRATGFLRAEQRCRGLVRRAGRLFGGRWS